MMPRRFLPLGPALSTARPAHSGAQPSTKQQSHWQSMKYAAEASLLHCLLPHQTCTLYSISTLPPRKRLQPRTQRTLPAGTGYCTVNYCSQPPSKVRLVSARRTDLPPETEERSGSSGLDHGSQRPVASMFPLTLTNLHAIARLLQMVQLVRRRGHRRISAVFFLRAKRGIQRVWPALTVPGPGRTMRTPAEALRGTRRQLTLSALGNKPPPDTLR